MKQFHSLTDRELQQAVSQAEPTSVYWHGVAIMRLQDPESKANSRKLAAQKLWGGFLAGLMGAAVFATRRAGHE